ncbi:TraR/DksA family transcriptional regulator [Streptomyces sp. NPDC090057]|uniref:TraR/DksA family transcriptional regulator n=1 Tax=Streptomyces sp. NPDC090057 TaxID=3365935 RepID=UPI003823156C
MVSHQTIGDPETHDTGPRAPAGHAPHPHLSPEDVAALRETLHEQRLFRQEQLVQIASAVPSRTDDLLRQSTAGQVEVHVKLAASARMVLSDVVAALDRMDRGSYGACHLCRRPIDRERLLIVPQTRYCARCQQVREAGR